MSQDYKDNLYAMATQPQYTLLGKEKGYSKTISHGGSFRCYQYHAKKRAQLIRDICDCSAGLGSFRNLTKQQRTSESQRLQNLQEAHRLKARIFGAACGIEVY